MDARFFSPMKNGCSTDVRCACVGLFYFCVMEKGGGRARQAHSLVPASNFSLTCKSFDRAEGLTSSLWVYYSFCVCVFVCIRTGQRLLPADSSNDEHNIFVR